MQSTGKTRELRSSLKEWSDHSTILTTLALPCPSVSTSTLRRSQEYRVSTESESRQPLRFSVLFMDRQPVIPISLHCPWISWCPMNSSGTPRK